MTDNKEQRLFLKYKYRFMRWKSHYFVYSMIYDYDYIEPIVQYSDRWPWGFPQGFHPTAHDKANNASRLIRGDGVEIIFMYV
jgi:hypothetical protein